MKQNQVMDFVLYVFHSCLSSLNKKEVANKQYQILFCFFSPFLWTQYFRDAFREGLKFGMDINLDSQMNCLELQEY